MSPDLPFRDTFWNVPRWAQVALYAGAVVAVAVFARGLLWRVQLWRAGGPESRFDRIPTRLRLVLLHALGQARTLAQAYPGVMHAALFWGFLALFLGTVLATIDYDVTLPWLNLKLLQGPLYLVYETVLDLFGLAFVVGLALAVWRRFVVRPARLDPAAQFGGVLALLLVINVTGFVMEACRLAAVAPPWGAWSPVGWSLAQGFRAAGFTEEALRSLHLGLWLFHAALSLAFVALVPYSYFIHLITTPLNIFFAKLEPRGAIAKIEHLEEAESLGVSRLEEFSWKRRLDFDACVECGRCQAVCPAHLAGTPLSPKHIMVKLKRHLHGQLPGPIHGTLIAPDELWACTTCMACVEECPAFIDIVDTIIDLRRYLTLSEGALPSTAPQSLQNIQRAGNPWGLPAAERLAWAQGLDVPVLQADREVEYLYWVGCSASYDKRNQAIARAVVRILRAAGVSFGVMPEERCHGEVARRLGDEYLYQTLQQETVAALQRYRFRKILTHCPHCFNTIAHEFPQFGGRWEVVHHAQLIRELVEAGRLRLRRGAELTVTFHDSCYLGRYNGIMAAPRAVARAVPGLRLVEMGRHGARGLCCGGGGGHMWMEVPARKRVNLIRVEEALGTGAGVVGTACPFCLAMIDLGRKVVGAEERLQVKDISELVAEHLEA